MKSIILLSGGLDSAVCFKRAVDETAAVLALWFDYGQPAARQEASASRRMARRFNVRHKSIALPWLKPLLPAEFKASSARLRTALGDEKAEAEAARAVWVPNRNGIFINVAAAFAESLDCDSIVAGFNAEEGASFPDNSTQYVEAANAALALSTLRRPRVISYTADLDKMEILAMARRIGAPLDLIWSCYYGGEEMCGECVSCQRLLRAVREEYDEDLKVLLSRFRK